MKFGKRVKRQIHELKKLVRLISATQLASRSEVEFIYKYNLPGFYQQFFSRNMKLRTDCSLQI